MPLPFITFNHLFFLSLPPDVAIPSMNCFWKIRYSTIIGIHASRDAAISCGKLLVYCPCILASAAHRGITYLIQIKGQIRSLYANTAVKIPSATMEERVRGAMMNRKV